MATAFGSRYEGCSINERCHATPILQFRFFRYQGWKIRGGWWSFIKIVVEIDGKDSNIKYYHVSLKITTRVYKLNYTL